MIIAQTPWSDALIALGGIFLVTAIAVALIWQIFKTGRAGIINSREKAYRQLAEETADFQSVMRTQIGQANEALADIQARVTEIERLLKEVE